MKTQTWLPMVLASTMVIAGCTTAPVADEHRLVAAPDTSLCSSTPKVVTLCNDATLSLGAYNVAVVGDRSKVTAGLRNVLVGGRKSTLACSGYMAFAGEGGRVNIGDGSMARVMNGGFASAELWSAAYANVRGHALTKQFGVAMATGGLAETRKEGVALGFTHEDYTHTRAIAIAGPAGIAIARQPADLVQAGAGGLLVGYWKDATGKLVVRSAAVGGAIRENTLYHLDARGNFVTLTPDEYKQAQADIKAWKKNDLVE